MKTKWTSLIVAGVILLLVGSQAMAQPWGPGTGQGPWLGRGQGVGRGAMRQGMGRRGVQGGPGAWCPLGAGQGALRPLGLGQFAPNGRLARRLGLNDDQIQKIRAILDKTHSQAMAAIKEVLTEEQAAQLKQLRDAAVRPGRGMQGRALQDAPVGPLGGRRFQQGMGQGAQMGPRGQRFSGQSFAGGRGMGQGPQLRGGMNRPDAQAVPPAGRQGVNPGQLRNRNVPAIEQMFDRADADQDGALTREEFRAFREQMQRRQ